MYVRQLFPIRECDKAEFTHTVCVLCSLPVQVIMKVLYEAAETDGFCERPGDIACTVLGEKLQWKFAKLHKHFPRKFFEKLD